jgi:hypothetical protein
MTETRLRKRRNEEEPVPDRTDPSAIDGESISVAGTPRKRRERAAVEPAETAEGTTEVCDRRQNGGPHASARDSSVGGYDHATLAGNK